MNRSHPIHEQINNVVWNDRTGGGARMHESLVKASGSARHMYEQIQYIHPLITAGNGTTSYGHRCIRKIGHSSHRQTTRSEETENMPHIVRYNLTPWVWCIASQCNTFRVLEGNPNVQSSGRYAMCGLCRRRRRCAFWIDFVSYDLGWFLPGNEFNCDLDLRFWMP